MLFYSSLTLPDITLSDHQRFLQLTLHGLGKLNQEPAICVASAVAEHQ